MKSIAFSGVAVLVAVVMSLGLLPRPLHAAAVAATGSLSETIPATAGNAIEVGPWTLTEPTAGAWAAADTITIAHAGITSAAATVSGAVTCTNCTVAYAAGSTTITITSVTAGVDTVSLSAVKLTFAANTAPGTAVAVTAGGTGVGSLTAGRLVLGLGTSTACTGGATRIPQSVSADPNAAGAALCSYVSDTTGAALASLPVTFSVSQGVVSTGTSKATTALTNASGLAATNYRGSGNNVTTDTAIASNSSINAVSTLSINLTAPTGNTASKVTIMAPSVQSIAATVTNTSPNYQSPSTGADVTVQVTDSAGLGVNGQVVLVTVDRGAIVANTGFAGTIATVCNGATSKSVTATTGSNPASRGAGTNTSGVINVTVCGNQTDAAGKMMLTAQNISTTMANATASIAMAGRPAKIEATANGNTVTATVTDAAGNRVADNTPVRFTISSNAGAVSTACAPTTNGVASSVAALVAATGTVIISADWNETGAAATCAAAGSQQIATSVTVPGGTSGGTGGTGGTGSGQITSGSIPQGGGFGLIVFGGGTIQQLVAATGCPTASMALWATVAGNFVTYVPGTTIGAVNADFMATFPSGVIPAGTPFIGKCR
jgi:hypothetical protein